MNPIQKILGIKVDKKSKNNLELSDKWREEQLKQHRLGNNPNVETVNTPYGKSLADPTLSPLKYCRGCNKQANTYKGYCETCDDRKQKGLKLKKTFTHKNYNKQR